VSRAAAMGLELQVETDAPGLAGAQEFSAWVDAALSGAGLPTGRDVTVRLVGRAESRKLNRRFRGVASPTNVLAFDGPPTARVSTAVIGELGDLVICLPLVYGEAEEQGKAPVAHLAHLVVHGTLHLAGYGHDSESDAGRMERLETLVMKRLGFPDPYA